MHQTGCTQTYDDTGAAKGVVTNLLARSFQGQENILWPSWISGWQLLDVLLLSILANFSGVIPISKFLWHNSNLIMELEKVTADTLQQNSKTIISSNLCVNRSFLCSIDHCYQMIQQNSSGIFQYGCEKFQNATVKRANMKSTHSMFNVIHASQFFQIHDGSIAGTINMMMMIIIIIIISSMQYAWPCLWNLSWAPCSLGVSKVYCS